MNFIIILYVITSVWAAQAEENGFTYNELNVTTGMIFTPLGSAQLSYEDFVVLFHYDITAYTTDIQVLKQTMIKIQDFCNLQKDSLAANCEITMIHIKEHVRKVFMDEELILSQEGSTKRNKRSWRIMKNVFGVMDEEDAEYYDKLITQTRKRMTHQEETMQTNILIMKKLNKYTNATFEDVKNKLIQLNDNLNSVSKSIHANQDVSTMNSLVSFFTMILIEIDILASELKELLTHDARTNLLDLVPKHQLEEALKEIQTKLDNDEQLPINMNNENIFHIYKAANLKTKLYNGNILLELRIPIITREKLDIFRAIPIPSQFGDKFAALSASSEIFITNKERSKYIPFTELELSSCFILSDNKRICPHSGAILEGEDNVCELALLARPFERKLPKTCHIQELPKQNYYINLHSANSYYCVITETLHPQVICKDKISPQKLEKSGILQLKKGCYLKDLGTTLRPHASANLEIKDIVNPQVILNKTIETNSRERIFNSSLSFVNNYNSKFGLISEALNDLQEEAEIFKFKDQTFKEIKNNVTSGCGIIAMIILVMISYLCYRFKVITGIMFIIKCCCKTSRENRNDLEMIQRHPNTPYMHKRTEEPFEILSQQ